MKKRINRYSMRLAGHPWEAEDLTQDVLLKVYKALETDASRHISNAYLYRIACTTWQDKGKKNKLRVQPADEDKLHRAGTDLGCRPESCLRCWRSGCRPRRWSFCC